MRVIGIVVLLACAVGRSFAQTPDVSAPTAPAQTAIAQMPALQFGSTIAAEEIYAALKSTTAFASIDREKPGSPIMVRVSHTYGNTSAGMASSVASVILSAGTLGLLPVVTNRDLVVTYEVVVNGSVVVSHAYSKNLTRVFNIHSKDQTHGLGADGLAWVTGTAARFAADVDHDAAYADLQSEYNYYYGTDVASQVR